MTCDHHPVVVIPCGGRKAAGPRPPAHLYTSGHFTMAVAAARALTTEDRILILSARHGLLRLDSPDPVAPYDERLDRRPRADQRQRVLAQRRGMGLPAALPVVALLPRAYLAVARAAFPGAVDAFAGARGIGDQRARLASITTKGRL